MLNLSNLSKYKEKFKTIENKRFGNERDLYNLNECILDNIQVKGEEDGESAIKECKNIFLLNSFLDLRYPLWHDENVLIYNTTFSENSRAALWYCKDITITDSKLLGIKALRECKNIILEDTIIASNEFGWKSYNIKGKNLNIQGEYLFFESSDLSLKNITFKGKYSFQYIDGLEIEESFLDTKDAFWHINNVTIKNSTIKGEYLGWYSNNLTLINCKIIGTQPLCYCKNLKLIDCEMINTDLAFEYSDIDATILGDIDSVKNIKSGKIKMINGKIKNVIKTSDSKFEFKCRIE